MSVPNQADCRQQCQPVERRLGHDRETTQQPRIPIPGSRSDPAPFSRFGYASASERGWPGGFPNTNLETGPLLGAGQSVSVLVEDGSDGANARWTLDGIWWRRIW